MKKINLIKRCSIVLTIIMLSSLTSNSYGQDIASDSKNKISTIVQDNGGQIIGSGKYKMVIAVGQPSPVGKISFRNGFSEAAGAKSLLSGFIPTLIEEAEQSNQPPGKPALILPLENTFTNNQMPIFNWQIPSDTDSDSLHFIIEVDTTDQFGAGKIVISSMVGSAGFDPVPPVAQGSGSIHYTMQNGLNSDVYWWRVSAYDNQAYSANSDKRSFTVDIIPSENPVLTPDVCADSSGSQNNVWQNHITNPRFTWQPGHDALSGVADYLLYWGADSIGTAITDSVTLPQYTPHPIDNCGTYFLRIKTRDRAGNSSPVWATIYRFKYDNIRPTGTIAGSDSISSETNFMVEWGETASDSGGSGVASLFDVRVKIGQNGQWQDWKTKTDSTYAIYKHAQQDSEYHFEAAAWDNAGNRELWTDVIETTTLIDTTREDFEAPAAPQNIAANGDKISPWQNQPEFSVTWDNPHDPSGIKHALYKIGSPPQDNFDTTGTVTGNSLSINVSQEDGQYLYVWLEDLAGNLDYSRHAWALLRYDVQLPQIDSLLITNADYDSSWYNPKSTPHAIVQLNFSEKHPKTPVLSAAGFQHELNTIAPQAFQFIINLQEHGDSSHTFQVEVADSAGNSVRDSVAIKLDQTQPKGAIALSPDSSSTEAFVVYWEGGTDSSGSGLSGFYNVKVREDDGSWQTWKDSVRSGSGEYAGNHGHLYGFQALVIDNVGNQEVLTETPETQTYVDTIKTAPPNRPPYAPGLISPAMNFVTSQPNVTLKWLVPVDEDGDSLHFKVEFDNDNDFSEGNVSYTSITQPELFSPKPAVSGSEHSVQFTIKLDENVYWWRVAAWDGHQYGQASGSQKFTLDLTEPTINTIPIEYSHIDSAITISANISDELSGVHSQKVIYRKGGDTATKTLSLVSGKATITKEAITSRGIEYAVIAEDVAGNSARDPQIGFVSVQVRIGEPGESPRNAAGVPIPFFIGSEKNAYRLLSIPLKPDKPAIEDVLFDDLGGEYDDTKWRFFDYGSGRFIEYPHTAQFSPGKAFFIIVRKGTHVITTGAGITLKTGAEYKIPLESSWNLVGNPYNFEMSIDRLSLTNGEPVKLWTYKGSWDTSSVFVPWEGYAVKTTADAKMVVNTIDSSTTLGKSIVTSSIQSPDNWSVQIIAHCQQALDRVNFAGIRSDASPNWDRHDMFEPPPIGEYVTLYFPHPDWSENADKYAADFRPVSNSGCSWDFEVETNISHEKVRLEFLGVESVTQDHKIFLIDRDYQVTRELSVDNSYVFNSGNAIKSRKFSLLVGSDNFIREQCDELEPVPQTYELSQNFPNPFNPETTIRYAIPAAGCVNITIYNLLGEQVMTLVDDVFHKHGYHLAIWDGRNAFNQTVASGIYLYRIQVNGFVKIQKMILLK